MADQNNEFYADELVAPAWLNTELLRQVLAKYKNTEELDVIDFKISPATKKGDHYASVMFRVAVDYTTEKGKDFISLIVKTMPELDGFKKDQLGESHIFQTEIGMYTEILPKFEAVLREAGDNTSLCVPCIYHSLEPRQVMIFVDLVPLGYTLVRDREPSLEEIECAYKKLSKWHAVSYKLYQEDPNMFEKFKYSIMELPKIMDDPFMHGIDYFIRMLDEVPDLRVYKSKFEKIRENYMVTFRDSFVEHRENLQENAYYLLCHGDLNIKNMMFKENIFEGGVEDCMLLDFQMSNVGPMPNDILYSIYQLLSAEQRQNFLGRLITKYFTTFTETLKKINFQGEFPLFAEFKRQMFRHRYMGKFGLDLYLQKHYINKKNYILLF